MGILSDAPLSSSPAPYFQFRLKLHNRTREACVWTVGLNSSKKVN